MAGSVAQGYLHMSPGAGLGTIASVIVLQPEEPREFPPEVGGNSQVFRVANLFTYLSI